MGILCDIEDEASFEEDEIVAHEPVIYDDHVN